MRVDITPKKGIGQRILCNWEMKYARAHFNHSSRNRAFPFKAKPSVLSPSWGLLTFFLALSSSALDLNPGAVISLQASSKGLTRLSLKGEGIKDLFLYPGTAQEGVMLHKSGDVFISPQHHGFFMTLMGSKGTKQDLDISFKDKDPSPILLESAVSPKKWTEPELGKLLLQVHQKTPEDLAKDFESWPFEEMSLNLTTGVTFKTIAAFRHQNVIVLQGEIKNHSSSPFRIQADSFPFMKMLSFENPVVLPSHHGTVYFLKKGDFKNAKKI